MFAPSTHPQSPSHTDDPARLQSTAVLASFLVIMATEIGDKTFLISAILAMRNPRSVIFSGTITALAIMTVLSAYLGHVVHALISKTYTQFLAAALFVLFGFKMLKEAYEMSGNETKDEIEEVKELLSEKDPESKALDQLESGHAHHPSNNNLAHSPFSPSNHKSSKNTSSLNTIKNGTVNLLNLVLSPIFVQTFTLTFLAEWGDRSQIATIAMAGSKDWIQVSIGSIVAHSICSGIAVIGGSLLAERISVRTVTFAGSILFILFGIIAFVEIYTGNELS